MRQWRNHIRALGPGLVYAGAAVGVSHLVQSTRAGAEYGFSLLWAVLLAHVFKYPAFEAGSRYTYATGRSLVQGYAGMGVAARLLFGLITLGGMFIIMAAICLVTAGICESVFAFQWSPALWVAALLALCGGILAWGRYRMLDRSMRLVVLLLTLASLLALLMVFRHAHGVPQNAASLSPEWSWEAGPVLFLLALMGWMPAPIDLSAWQSVWIREKMQDQPWLPWDGIRFDFHAGYIGACLLAVIFMSLGALILHPSGTPMPTGGAAFATRFINIFTDTIGAWIRPVIALAALATMFSTSLTVMDAYPRMLVELWQYRRGAETPALTSTSATQGYYAGLLAMAAGAMALVVGAQQAMTTMVDFATMLSFLTAPVLAALNYRLLQTAKLAPPYRLGPWMHAWHLLGLLFMVAFSLVFLYVQ